MKRTRDIKRLFIAIMLLMVHPAVSHAFGLSGWGGKVGLLDPEGASSGSAISAHLEYDQPGTAWHILPSVMFWDSDGLAGLSGNFDMYYHFVPEGVATPYAGAGVGINHFDFDGPGNGSTRLGLNLFGGLRFPTGSSHLFLEGRYTSSRISQISLLGGVTFLGGR